MTEWLDGYVRWAGEGWTVYEVVQCSTAKHQQKGDDDLYIMFKVSNLRAEANLSLRNDKDAGKKL